MVTTEGRRDVLRLWAGACGEGRKRWMLLTEIKNCGVGDVLMLFCLTRSRPSGPALPSRPVSSLLQNSFRYAARQTGTR